VSEWFPPLDAALGGVGDAVGGIGDVAGDAAGGLFGPLGNFILQLSIIAAVVILTVVMMT
jgi:hypothetical protein